MKFTVHKGKRPWKPLLLVCVMFSNLTVLGSEEPAVRVQPTDSVGPRTLEKQTETAVIRAYLEAWQNLGTAMDQNRDDLLDAYFVGVAKEKLAATIHEQQELGIKTRYRDRAHDLKVVFYSPEGLSVQLLDTVEYDEEVLDDHAGVQAIQHIRSHYVAVLTPTEVRWKVRVFQAEPE